MAIIECRLVSVELSEYSSMAEFDLKSIVEVGALTHGGEAFGKSR
ncbi:MAG: hypothetical protein ACP5LB_07415 [Candidatus Bathyarchaeia archaeon]